MAAIAAMGMGIVFDHNEFKEKLKTIVTNKILTTNLEDLVEDKKLTKILNNKYLLNEIKTFTSNMPAALASGQQGSVFEFGNFILKQSKICPNKNRFYNMCKMSEDDDPQYNTVNTDKDNKQYDIPLYILEILTGVYISNKISPYTDGFCKTYGGLYDKKNKITYSLQEKLVPTPGLGRGLKIFNMSAFSYTHFLFEMLSTLLIAQNKHCYTHYDLHIGNVMFRETLASIDREYTGGDFLNMNNIGGPRLSLKIKIQNQYQPVIIDYGLSRFSSENVIFQPSQNFRVPGFMGLYMDNHLFNAYYDMIRLIRSFMLNSRNPDGSLVNEPIYVISCYLLCFIFNLPHNDPTIQITYINYLFDGDTINHHRIIMDRFNVINKNNIYNVLSYLAHCMENNNFIYYHNTPSSIYLSHPTIPLTPDLNTTVSVTLSTPNDAQYNPNKVKRHILKEKNYTSYPLPIVVSSPGESLGGLSQNYAWQYNTYTLSRTTLGFTGQGFIVPGIDPKWYNLYPNYHNLGQSYKDDISIACAVMPQPYLMESPFIFKTDCCNIDTKRYLQNKLEGISINASFFNWKTNFGTVGPFKKNQLLIDDTSIPYHYKNDYEYIVIDKDGNLTITEDRNIDSLNLDIDQNSSLFMAGPLLVKNSLPVFNMVKILETYSVYEPPIPNKVYYKYLQYNEEQRPIPANDRLETILTPAKYQYALTNGLTPQISTANIDDYDSTHIPPVQTINTSVINVRKSSSLIVGEPIHGASPNPRSVLAITNNNLVLFFVFPGRDDGFGTTPANSTQSSGLDFVDLSSLLSNPSLLTPLNLPAATQIVTAINLDGGGSSSIAIKERGQNFIKISSRNSTSSYPVGNVLSYIFVNE